MRTQYGGNGWERMGTDGNGCPHWNENRHFRPPRLHHKFWRIDMAYPYHSFVAGQSVHYAGSSRAWARVVNPQLDQFGRISIKWVFPHEGGAKRRERVDCEYIEPAPAEFIDWLETLPWRVQTSPELRRVLFDVSHALQDGTIWTGNGCIAETLRAFKASQYRDTSKAIERWLGSEPDREPDYPEWLVPRCDP